MTKTSTSLDLILYAYKELQASEELLLEYELMSDSELQEEFSEIVNLLGMLDNAMLTAPKLRMELQE